MDFPKDVNLECLDGYQSMDGIPLTFGFEFEPKGNLTFTHNEAVKH